MAEALARAAELWPGEPIRIGAQARLEKFYEEFGFRKTDLTQPRAGVYMMADDGELAFAAPSFADFVRDLGRRVANARAIRALPWWKRWFSSRK